MYLLNFVVVQNQCMTWYVNKKRKDQVTAWGYYNDSIVTQ